MGPPLAWSRFVIISYWYFWGTPKKGFFWSWFISLSTRFFWCFENFPREKMNPFPQLESDAHNIDKNSCWGSSYRDLLCPRMVNPSQHLSAKWIICPESTQSPSCFQLRSPYLTQAKSQMWLWKWKLCITQRTKSFPQIMFWNVFPIETICFFGRNSPYSNNNVLMFSLFFLLVNW